VQDGVHALGLTVRDASGATATATRTVTVNNNTAARARCRFPSEPCTGPGHAGTVPVQITVSGASGTNNRFTVFVDGVQQAVIASNTTTVT